MSTCQSSTTATWAERSPVGQAGVNKRQTPRRPVLIRWVGSHSSADAPACRTRNHQPHHPIELSNHAPAINHQDSDKSAQRQPQACDHKTNSKAHKAKRPVTTPNEGRCPASG